eukprot:TRINITY_DN331_c0_g1_i1.p1 TRINITY_DN331_c0_g1~~TRINITY_DN331_c0_g1_i1.p1  ORF type:complete len:450 (-),score=26.92 TRINITY_DN331_c0_g1_i1:119-1468(-)
MRAHLLRRPSVAWPSLPALDFPFWAAMWLHLPVAVMSRPSTTPANLRPPIQSSAAICASKVAVRALTAPPSTQTLASTSPWNRWAKTVSRNPTPINFKLQRIGAAIPSSWIIAGRPVRDWWKAAEVKYYLANANNTYPAEAPSWSFIVDFSCLTALPPDDRFLTRQRVLYFGFGRQVVSWHTPLIRETPISGGWFANPLAFALTPVDFSYSFLFQNQNLGPVANVALWAVNTSQITNYQGIYSTYPPEIDDFGIRRFRIYDWNAGIMLPFNVSSAEKAASPRATIVPASYSCSRIELDFFLMAPAAKAATDTAQFEVIVVYKNSSVSFFLDRDELQPPASFPKSKQYRWAEIDPCAPAADMQPLATLHRVKSVLRPATLPRDETPLLLQVRAKSVPSPLSFQLRIEKVLLIDRPCPTCNSIMYRIGVPALSVGLSSPASYTLYRAFNPY